jgi:D-alanyl-D-alanine carboxypeptidase/D-alanyl-D-alanine-endopeptidase (penicillin-binding protein 4)
VYLASHNGEAPNPAASLTKIFTTLAVLRYHQLDGKALAGGSDVAPKLWSMNSASNNPIADSYAREVGGAQFIQDVAVQFAGVIPDQIHLVNGSGLPPLQDDIPENDVAERNIISAKGVCDAYASLFLLLEGSGYPLSKVFPIAGQDGTIRNRHLPSGTIGKTGTLNAISALAVMVPRGSGTYRCVAIINSTSSNSAAHRWQESLINRVSN